MTALESRNLIQLNMSKVINYQPPLSQRVRGFLSGTFSASTKQQKRLLPCLTSISTYPAYCLNSTLGWPGKLTMRSSSGCPSTPTVPNMQAHPTTIKTPTNQHLFISTTPSPTPDTTRKKPNLFYPFPERSSILIYWLKYSIFNENTDMYESFFLKFARTVYLSKDI